MNSKEHLIYALHNLGNCENSGYNSLIRLLCDTDKYNIEDNQNQLRKINDLVFEMGVTFKSEYPSLLETFIAECKIVATFATPTE